MTVETQFERTFGAPPDTTSATPGRVNIIGEHIDYNGGWVLPAAIERYIHVGFRHTGANFDEIYSTNFPDIARISLDGSPNGQWSDYVGATLKLLRTREIFSGGAQLVIDANLPHGAGLSSSAALIVSILKATIQFAGRSATPSEIALLAQQVENDYLGVPCGVMDQFAVACARPGYAIALNTQDLSYQTVTLPEHIHFAVLHSGIERKLNDGRYRARRDECAQAAKRLGAAHLCDLTKTQTAMIASLPDPLKRRAVHAVEEQARVERAINALRGQEADLLGAILTEGHRSLRDNFEVSLGEIDALVDGAVKAGALGARLTGGGFGGCIVACVPKDQLPAWKDRMATKYPNTTYIV